MLHHIENHIDNMRQKPDHVKKQYALLVSGSITLVIFGFWLAAKRPNNEAIAAKPMQPVKTLTASVGDAYDYMRGLLFGINKNEYSSENIEVVGGKN